MEQMTSTNTATPPSRGLMDRIRETTASQLTSQKDRATDGLGSLARAVRHSTDSFRENQQDTVAQYLEKAADQIERLSSNLRARDANALMKDAQQFARRRPAIFMGAAFAAGLLTARFLKSSGRPGGIAPQAYGGG